MSLSNYYSLFPYLLIISSFGIYIGGGLRVEHLVLYPSALLLLAYLTMSGKFIIKNIFRVFMAWLLVFLISAIVTIFRNAEVNVLSAIADAESFLQPLIIIAIFMFVFKSKTKEQVSETIFKLSNLLLILLSLNTVFIFFSLVMDVSQIGQLFWGGDNSVASRAAGNGRLTGIFNQPLESGVMYSIGLLSWLFISEKAKIINLKYTIALCLILLGGVLSVSKIFIFGGILLFALGVLFNRKKVSVVFWLTILLTLVGFAMYQFLVKTWTGLDYLFRFFGANDNFILLLTAGRFGGDNSQQSNLFREVWRESPLYGRGFGATPVYDSGYFQFFAVGGTIGFLFLIGLMMMFLIRSWKFLKQNNFGVESKMFFLITLLIIGSSFGSPTLTLNRVSTVVWIFVLLLLHYFYKEKTFQRNKRLDNSRELAE